MRKLFLAVLLLTVSITSSWAMKMACNVDGMVYYGDQIVFKNIMFQGKRWWACDPNDVTVGNNEAMTDQWEANMSSVLNADRYPKVAPVNGSGFCSNVLVEMWKDIFPEGEFTLVYEGTGTVKLGGLHTATIPSSGAKTTYKFSLLKSEMAWGNMGSFSRQPRNKQNLRVAITESSQADPIHNLRLLLPGYSSYDPSNPFTDEFVSRIKYSPFTVIRFMDWAKVNFNMDVKWSDRTTENAYIQTGGFRGQYPHEVAYEHMITLCNLTGKDMWLNVPGYVDDNYIQNLAELVHNKLDPSLNVWIEYANEVWNGMFKGYDAAVAISRANNLAPIDKAWQHNNYGYTYRTIQICETFESVFGAGSGRIIPTLHGWANGITWSQLRVDALKDPKVNPNNYQIKYFGTTAYHGSQGGTDQLLAPGGNWRVHIDMCQAEGLEWISYEAGIGSATMPVNLMYDAYKYTLSKLKAAGHKVYNEFHLNGTWGAHRYGAIEYITQPIDDAPKYKAICDWTVANNATPGFTIANVDKVEEWETAINYSPRTKNTFTVNPIGSGMQIFDLHGRLIPNKAINQLAPVMYLQSFKNVHGQKVIKSDMRATIQ